MAATTLGADANLEDGVAPQQCPNCGRFLKHVLVDSLVAGDQPCPGCQQPLTAHQFGSATDPPSGVAPSASAATSVRPPDLAPAKVRDDDDALARWDVGADAAEIASWNHDRAPFPTDTVVVAGGALVGAVVGFRVTPERFRGAAVGGGLGIVVTAAARQVWRLKA